jgi:hypothetical protein
MIIVDNFYKNPTSVREKAMNLEYVNASNNDGFNGGSSPISKSSKLKIMKRISSLFNFGIYFLLERQGDFKILTSKQQKVKNTIIHIDLCDWSGVLCLTPPDIIQGYTSFWTHNKLQLSGLHDVKKVAQVCSESKMSVNTLIDRVDKDSAKLSCWTETSRILHCYNRLILFKGNMFHSSGAGFGTKLENCKLSQTFFFHQWNGNKRQMNPKMTYLDSALSQK